VQARSASVSAGTDARGKKSLGMAPNWIILGTKKYQIGSEWLPNVTNVLGFDEDDVFLLSQWKIHYLGNLYIIYIICIVWFLKQVDLV
jgi:hypothetical protein